MKKHSFDAVSFIFGALFLLAGIPLLISDEGWDVFGERWVFPAFLVGAGLIVLLTTRLSNVAEDDDQTDPFAERRDPPF